MDWATAASLATAAGTLVLALATFAAVRSSNRSARIAEQAMLARLRPLLAASRLDDPVQKVHFMDRKVLVVQGGRGAAEATDDAVYLAISVRNAGQGIAVEHGWAMVHDVDANSPHTPVPSFRRLTRDLFIGPNDVGFWQGALRDPAADGFAAAKQAIESGDALTIDILYGDAEGGQRTITRFRLTRYNENYLAAVGRHWMLDRSQPR
jgi:hypothetical protein